MSDPTPKPATCATCPHRWRFHNYPCPINRAIYALRFEEARCAALEREAQERAAQAPGDLSALLEEARPMLVGHAFNMRHGEDSDAMNRAHAVNVEQLIDRIDAALSRLPASSEARVRELPEQWVARYALSDWSVRQAVRACAGELEAALQAPPTP